MGKKFLGVLFLWIMFSATFIGIREMGGVGRVLAAGPVITFRSDNGGVGVGKWEKFEANFDVSTTATNWQMPYDPAPPGGINQSGVSVDGVFTSPSGKIYRQPAFFYEGYSDFVKPDQFGTNQEWFLANGQNQWKVRFAPDEEGIWQYYLEAKDSGGSGQSGSRSFKVVTSNSHGFLRVSGSDNRYFEFSDGSYFPALGFNLNFSLVDWGNPVLSNSLNFQKMNQNGIQLVRMWLSQWSIFGSQDNPWESIRGSKNAGLITYGSNSTASNPSSVMVLVYDEDGKGNRNTYYFDACRFMGHYQRPAVEQNTNYKVFVRYWARGIEGPRTSDLTNYPNQDNFGLMAKVQNPAGGGWHGNCFDYSADASNGLKLSSAYGKDSANWTYYQGSWNSGNNNFLPTFYLTLENVKSSLSSSTGTRPYVYIDRVYVVKDALGCAPTNLAACGPNVVDKPSMEHLLYFQQRNSYAFDKVLDLAHQNGVYLKVNLLEKLEQIQNEIGPDGGSASWDGSNYRNMFGALGRTMTPVRWLQMAYFRYVQARWGYSTNIHSWELLNEGDPDCSASHNDGCLHAILADELAKYMHQFGADKHMVTTSNWFGLYPGFWNTCSNCDYVDEHKYNDQVGDPNFWDTAKSSYDLSRSDGASAQLASGFSSGRPVMRGEAGFVDPAIGIYGGNPFGTDYNQGVWLHNYLWAGLNPYGLMESYWITNYGDGVGQVWTNNYDLRPIYKTLYNFVKGLPLNNGKYGDAAATFGNTNLRVWGQKDIVNRRAHLWIANALHTWKNVVSGTVISPITTTVTISGMAPGNNQVEWWDTYTGIVSRRETVAADSQGNLTLNISNLTSDVAVKIGDYFPLGSLVGDGNADGISPVNALDLNAVLLGYLKTATNLLNQYGVDQKINAWDFVVVLKRLP